MSFKSGAGKCTPSAMISTSISSKKALSIVPAYRNAFLRVTPDMAEYKCVASV
ncbi:hypothetical protein D3C87_1876390 [compost metagenome]